MLNTDVTYTCAEWLKTKLRDIAGNHNFAIFTYQGEFGWEDYIHMSDLKALVEYNKSLIIYDRELDTFTKYDNI